MRNRGDLYMRAKGMIFNIGFLICALASIIILFMPYAKLSESNNSSYTIIVAYPFLGITIFLLTVVGFIFSFIKRKKVIIMGVGIGFATHGLFALSVLSQLEPVLQKTVQSMERIGKINDMLGEGVFKVTYKITPAYYLFAITCLLAAAFATITFYTTEDY